MACSTINVLIKATLSARRLSSPTFSPRALAQVLQNLIFSIQIELHWFWFLDLFFKGLNYKQFSIERL